MKKLLNIEYAISQGAYWMYYGVVASFASVFLLERDYSNSQIGLIIAVGSVFAVILQPFASDLADNPKKISLIHILELMTLILGVGTLGLFLFDSKSLALSTVFIFLVGWHASIQPLVNSLSFHLQESGYKINFGVARSIGSLSYAVLMALLGSIVERVGILAIPIAGLIVLVVLFIILILIGIHFNKAKDEKSKEMDFNKNRIRESNEIPVEISLKDFVINNKIFMIMNIGVIGLYFSNSILNNFMIQIVTNVGGDSGDMGRIMSVMAALEIPTMVVFDRINLRFNTNLLLKISAVGFAIKVGLCYLASSVFLLYIAQLTQLFSFALFLPAMVHFIDETMRKGEAIKGQAVYTMMATVAAVIASLLGGVILDMSGAKMLLFISTIVTLAGALLIVFKIDDIPAKDKK